jgi:hypothetical protein
VLAGNVSVAGSEAEIETLTHVDAAVEAGVMCVCVCVCVLRVCVLSRILRFQGCRRCGCGPIPSCCNEFVCDSGPSPSCCIAFVCNL